jgi:hypothetical protein
MHFFIIIKAQQQSDHDALCVTVQYNVNLALEGTALHRIFQYQDKMRQCQELIWTLL